jgi:hypothetical protein
VRQLISDRAFEPGQTHQEELDMDEKTLRAIIADELNKQDRELWVVGTGKQLVIDRLERVEAAVNEIKAGLAK